MLLAVVTALIVGWWITPLGIAAIIAIKLAYVAMLVGYRRAGQSRQSDGVQVAMTAHSIASVLAIAALLAP